MTHATPGADTGAAATEEQRQRAAEVLRRLRARYPDATCTLQHDSAWQLLCATILSAQCTDERVNRTTPDLFARYPTPEAMAAADPAELENAIRSCGTYRTKAASLIAMCQEVVARGGEVPQTLEDLTAMRGVGRKTANVVLGNCFGGQAVVVDTHVRRIAGRLGWTTQTDPDKIEADLMALLPPDLWTEAGHLLIAHGRAVCPARKPLCGECPVSDLCPAADAGL